MICACNCGCSLDWERPQCGLVLLTMQFQVTTNCKQQTMCVEDGQYHYFVLEKTCINHEGYLFALAYSSVSLTATFYISILLAYAIAITYLVLSKCITP